MHRVQQIQIALHSADGVLPGKDPLIEKHQKMAANPFRFFRGSANLFYDDIYQNVLCCHEQLNNAIPLTMVQGDCHLSNFGFFTEEGSHGDKVIFAPNDFDDACLGHASWDLLRYMVSLLLAQEYCEGIVNGRYQSSEIADSSNMQVCNLEDTITALQEFLCSYVQQCQKMADNDKHRSKVISRLPSTHPQYKLYKKARRRAAGGKQFVTKSSLAKAIEFSGLLPEFKEVPDKFVAIDDSLYREIHEVFSPYVDDTILDIVRRLGAGTGSVNMDRFYLLVGPRDYSSEEDLPLCHIVEIKEQRMAAPLGHFESLAAINRLNPAHLTVVCQRKMQRKPDLVLDEVVWRGSHWLVRSRHHARVGVDPEDVCLVKQGQPSGIVEYASLCGQALALAHGRGDRRSVRFEVAVAEYLPQFYDDLLDSALRYAVRVREDQQILQELINC